MPVPGQCCRGLIRGGAIQATLSGAYPGRAAQFVKERGVKRHQLSASCAQRVQRGLCHIGKLYKEGPKSAGLDRDHAV